MIPELLNLIPKLDKESGIWRMEVGMCWVLGNGAVAITGTAISFQEAFLEPPFMFGNAIGQRDSASSEPVEPEDFDLASAHDLVPFAVSTSGFTPYYTKFNTAFSATRYFGCNWIAIGKKA